MNWYLKVLKQYADFKGRARRTEYWMFALFNFLIWIVLFGLSLGLAISGNSGMFIAPVISILLILYYLVILVPSLAVLVRRLHDQNKSGAWFFIAFVPLVGGIWLLVLLCTDGTPGPNQYGPDPKGQASFNDEALDSHLTT